MNKYITYNKSLLKRNQNQKRMIKWQPSWWQATTIIFLLYIFLAAGFYILPFKQSVVEFFNRIQNRIVVNQIITTGNLELSHSDVLRCGNIDLAKIIGTNLWKIDPWQISNDLLKCKIIESAEVNVPFNGNIIIRIKERIPKVIWLTNDKLYLLDQTGLIISEEVRQKQKENMVILVGIDAPQNFNNIIDLLSQHQYFKENLASMHFVGSRRWNLFMQNGQIIKLPEKNINDCLEFLIALREKYLNIADNPTLDLRLFPEKIFISSSSDKNLDLTIGNILDRQEKTNAAKS